MANHPKVVQAIKEAAAELLAMPNDEFAKLMAEEEAKLRRAILEGFDHLGLAIWYAQDPSGAQAYVEQVLKEDKCQKDSNPNSKIKVCFCKLCGGTKIPGVI